MINPKYTSIEAIQDIQKQFFQENFVKHIVLDNFLEWEFYNKIRQELYSSNKRVTWDMYGRQIIYITWTASRSLFWYYTTELAYFLSQVYNVTLIPEFQKWGNNILPHFLIPLLFRKWFFYRRNMPSSFLDWHTDGPSSKIAGSFLLYLNDWWKQWDGGELELWYYNQWAIHSYKKIFPLWNRAVFLKCEENVSWHRVTTCNKDRYFIHDQLLII